MSHANIVLIAACGALGFGIIWSMVPSKRSDSMPPPDRDDAPPGPPAA